ncbi:MAG: hypothetical protein IPJ65_08745 [Archangiaceae bacterium]|nr:hypothetical protein [Archangiaceae bacterium]
MWLSIAAGLTLAQFDAGPQVPMPAETDNHAAEVQRSLDPDAGLLPVPAPAVEQGADAGLASPTADRDALAVTTPSSGDELDGKISAALRLSETLVSWFPIDDQGSYVGPRPFETRLRVAPEVHFRGFGALAEFDAASGAVAGNVPQTAIADRVPVPGFNPIELRQLYLEYRWKTGLFRFGQQTSHWGLGLIANSGAGDAQPGDFGQAHFGTLVYRAMLGGRPFHSLGGNWRAVEIFGAADLVWKDNTADFGQGDRAFQGVLAARFKVDDQRYAGLYAVYRRQRAFGVTDGGQATDVLVLDFAAQWRWVRDDERSLALGFEAAGVVGTTTQTRSDVAPVAQVRQFGAAAKATWRVRSLSVLLDWGYASGDQNPYDDRLEGFRFDRDYKAGLVLFDQVLGYQSARAGFRAADPQVTGRPPDGVNLVPTAGAVYNAWYLFPRLRVGFTEWLDLYGGPLVAFSTARLTDPYSTAVKGGTPTNYLGASPGGYLGTELDLGLQARWRPHRLLAITGTLEGGLLLPGDALVQVGGTPMGPVGLLRLRLLIAL